MLDEEARPGISPADRYHLCFALGKALEDRGDYEKSYRYYERGNQLKHAEIRYRPEIIERNTRMQMGTCTRELLARRAGVGSGKADPIFIVGLPRSGSTLLEQILASHSRVEGTHELADIQRIVHELQGREDAGTANPRYPRVLGDLSAEEFLRLGEKYLSDTRIYRTDKPFFIDKMPNNFRHIGLIHLMLPNARIIDARREPMACCFSNFKQLFASGQEFTYSIEDIARYYRTYLALMDHWNAVLPGRILKIDHESIVEDLDANIRRLLDFCGLEFESACLDFHKTERSVRTASSEQVRQPIFREGLDQWKNFEPWLGPLKTALGDASGAGRMTDPILLTPGPLTTSTETKTAMLSDWGSWDGAFNAMTASVCRDLLAIVHAQTDHVCVPLQGSGTFAVEAALGTLVPRHGKVLVPDNGAYCKRIARILKYQGREAVVLPHDEQEPSDPARIDAALAADPAITHVAQVHCETGTGILNPLHEIAATVANRGRRLIIDAMSSFGAIPIDARALEFDGLITASGKCLEGVPGMGVVIARRAALETSANNSASLVMDLLDQWQYMQKTGQWRFTPPTHVLAALRAALGSVPGAGRAARSFGALHRKLPRAGFRYAGAGPQDLPARCAAGADHRHIPRPARSQVRLCRILPAGSRARFHLVSGQIDHGRDVSSRLHRRHRPRHIARCRERHRRRAARHGSQPLRVNCSTR